MYNATGFQRFLVLSDEEIARIRAEGAHYSKRAHNTSAQEKAMWPVIFGLFCEYGPRASEPFWLRRSE